MPYGDLVEIASMLPNRVRWRRSLEKLRSRILSTYIRMTLAYMDRVASPMLGAVG